MIAVSGIGLLGIAAWVLLARPHARPMPHQPATIAVREGSVVGSLRVMGRLDFERTVRVGSGLPGQLVAVNVDVGDAVTQGQVLARLDNLDQRSTVDAAGAQRTMAEIQVTQAERRLLQTLPTSNHVRDNVPPDDLLEGAAGEAQLDLLMAIAYYKKHDVALALARGQLLRRAIRAPFDGIVVGRPFDRGETIAASPPGPPLFVIDARPGHLILRAEIADAYVARVGTGPARVTFLDSATNRSFSGEVVGVSAIETPSAVPMTGARAHYEVRLAIENADGTLRPGLSAMVDLPMSSSEAALRVPVLAVDRSLHSDGHPIGGETSVIWAVHGNGPPAPLPVKLGVSDGTYVEVSGPGVTPRLKVAIP